MVDGEALVVFRDAMEPEALEAFGDVVHRVSARLLVVRVDEATFDHFGNDPRVAYAGPEPPLDLIDELDEQERLFVDGWLIRGSKIERTGDGLSWDAEGMMPPDLPRQP